MPQMSAPIAPPNDFSHAFQTRTPMRDSFGASAIGLGHQGQNSGDRGEDFSQDPLGMKRKRSYPGTSSATTAGSGGYGTTS
jgi:hypothetical protein